MKIKFQVLVIFSFFLPLHGICQADKPVISFVEKEFNFGTFSEVTGIVTHDFRFTNTGKTPLIIQHVKATCGCTVPEWPREPIKPGKSGVIKVTFDPKKQNGPFSKTIQVSSNADIPQVNLVVKGVVIPAELVEDAFKFMIGPIRLETIYVAFGEIYKGKPANLAVKVYNTSKDEPAVISFRQVPPHLKIKVVPASIDPEQEGRIELEYLTENLQDWDYVVNRLELLVNGKVHPNNRLNITANIREDFSSFTAEEMEAAPRAEFDNQSFDFGTVVSDTVVEHDFKLINAGKSDLFIRKVSASCGCTAVQPAKVQIRPGESTLIKARFNATGREGNQKKAITVITNDPRRSKTILWVNGIVTK